MIKRRFLVIDNQLLKICVNPLNPCYPCAMAPQKCISDFTSISSLKTFAPSRKSSSTRKLT